MSARSQALLAAQPAAASAPTTLTFVASNEVDATSITLPTGSAAGDLCVLWDWPANSSGTPSNVVPTGFTQVDTQTAAPLRVTLSYKVLTSGDISGGSVSGMSGTSVSRKGIASFRPNHPINTVTASTPGSEGTAGNPAQQTISMTALSSSVPAVAIGSSRGSTHTPTGTLTSSGSNVSSNNTVSGYYEIQNTTKTDRTFDMGDSGAANVLQSFYLAVT